MIEKQLFIKKYNISEELIKNSEMSWEDLCAVYDDYSKNKYEKYKKIMEDFLNNYLRDINEENKFGEGKEVKIHSIRYRVKDAEHLIVKIIRKKQENQLKYRLLDKYNYEKFVTDLIGIRCLVLFKDDWENLHYYLMSKFENNVEYYIKDSISDFDDNVEHNYFAEKPKVHIRNGDSRECYEKVLPPDSVIDNKIYRSIHYIIKFEGVYLEIQVRTLFEEGWGEVNHAVVYPYYQNDKILKEYTELLNRLSGLADEMSGFFNRLKQLEISNIQNNENKENNNDNNTDEANGRDTEKINVPEDEEKISNMDQCNTPADCLKKVCSE